MAEGRILVVEDDRILVLMLENGLRLEGYTVESITRGDEAIARVSRGDIDLVVLDVTLPGKDGFDVCHEVRTRGIQTPVVMLTARDDLEARVQGLKLGADDYVTKPFEMAELSARIEALLRRARFARSETFACGDLRVDFRRASVWREGRAPAELSGLELKLLHYFVNHRGEVLSREELLEKVWGYVSMPLTRTVDVHVRTLRQKIERDPSNPEHIVTMHGVGYKFLPER